MERLGRRAGSVPGSRIVRVAELAAAITCPDAQGGLVNPREILDTAGRVLGLEEQRCADLLEGAVAEPGSAMYLEKESVANEQGRLMRRGTTNAPTVARRLMPGWYSNLSARHGMADPLPCCQSVSFGSS